MPRECPSVPCSASGTVKLHVCMNVCPTRCLTAPPVAIVDVAVRHSELNDLSLYCRLRTWGERSIVTYNNSSPVTDCLLQKSQPEPLRIVQIRPLTIACAHHSGFPCSSSNMTFTTRVNHLTPAQSSAHYAMRLII